MDLMMNLINSITGILLGWLLRKSFEHQDSGEDKNKQKNIFKVILICLAVIYTGLLGVFYQNGQEIKKETTAYKDEHVIKNAIMEYSIIYNKEPLSIQDLEELIPNHINDPWGTPYELDTANKKIISSGDRGILDSKKTIETNYSIYTPQKYQYPQIPRPPLLNIPLTKSPEN